MFVRVLACSAVLALAACASHRPMGEVCRAEGAMGPAPSVAERGLVEAPIGPSAPDTADLTEASGQLRALIEEALGRSAPSPGEGAEPRHLLALSAGGPFAAFGGGVLNGWSDETGAGPTRPADFRMVTGVSAGALLATHAFLGAAYDGLLKDKLRNVPPGLVEQRWLPSLLWSNSIFDTSGLRSLVETLLPDEVLDAVAAESRRGRLLVVLATNLDTGQSGYLDLTRIAREETGAARRRHYVDAIMASSAIPVAFPPVFIDDDMYVDGGARTHVFLTDAVRQYALALEALGRAGGGSDPEAVFVVMNNELFVGSQCTSNSLPGIAERTITVAGDQLARDSLYRVLREAHDHGLRPYYLTAEGVGDCKPGSDAFLDRDAMRCLFDYGEGLFDNGADPWREPALAPPAS